jgi:hypothetical protein
MVCPTCYQDYISKCSNSIIVNAQLDPDTDFAWQLEDKFGNLYGGILTTDGDGLAVLDISELPEGLFTPHSGFFTLRLLGITNGGNETLTIGSTAYDCIEFDVRGGNYVKTYLGEFTEEPVSS